MIQLQHISKKYRTDLVETTALADINLSIAAGEFVSVMGPSGCGKSTLLNIMGLIDEPTEGSLLVNNTQVTGMGGNALARFRNEKLGFIFQSFHLIPELNVLDNVQVPLIYRSIPNSRRRQLAQAALEAVGLTHRMQHYPNQLSGGQKQRVAIARAIAGSPAILLADEPTGNLDSVMGNEIMQILIQLNQTHQTTIVMVTHDEAMARKTHRLIRLYDGRQV
ncbi:MAG: ABC transporter ATP-binding protein [Chitinophagaceae bacterium]|jgi:putative ABC transport system ATP-binding protein|nr:ABC transporter ATP-binding protein [Chitinophagaceae bacterium]